MKSIPDINLLIFDLDGTILKSDKANLIAIKKVFSELNINVSIDINDIRTLLTRSSEYFYSKILPEEKIYQWKYIRGKEREEYYSSFLKYGKLFDGALDTLKILKKREYKTAICSNCSDEYLKIVFSIFKLDKYFDSMECTQRDNLSKTELVKKIIKDLGNLKAAVIGDREVDITAAKNNHILSIGALYGFGPDEIKDTDITINKFSELLEIFDRKKPIFEKIFEEIKKRKQKNKHFVIGVNGIDASGKTYFAQSLEKFLQLKHLKTQTIFLDDFHNPAEIRHSGINEIDSYYNRSFNIKLIINKLLEPASSGKDLNLKINVLNLYSNKYEEEREYHIDKNKIIIIEGVFLFRKELSPFLDYKIFLDVPFKEIMKRVKNRDIERFGVEIIERYKNKYIPTQKKYLKSYPPFKVADMVINNTNWEYPRIGKQ